MKKSTLTEDKAEQTPTGGVLVGKRKGQTIIHDKGTLSGYLVGRTHAEGGIKAVNKSTGQPLEMQGGEIIITAPAVSDTTKNEFNGKMMTNREVLSAINEKGGGVSFAKGGDIPKNIKRTGASYKYGGKTMTDHEIYKRITGGHLADGMTLSQISKKHNVSLKDLQTQVDMGMKSESEHTSSKSEQMKIVKDHLFENPKYYSLLKRAGLKHGGRINKISIVRNTKRANSQTKDLNNLSDVLDIDADGVYGAETGLFDNGGSVKEAVEYVTIGSQSENPYMDIEKVKHYNFIDFKDFVRGLYNVTGATNKRLIFLCVNNEDSFSEANINISKGKNTNKNFNPFTGSFDAFFKNISDKLVAREYDWNKWGGVITSKTTPSQTSNQISPDNDSVISIMVLDKDKTTIATATNVDELSEILKQAQRDKIQEFKLKYIFNDSSIFRAYYVSWIEDTPSMGTDINPSKTSATELKEWLKLRTDLKSKKFNLDYFFSKGGSSSFTTPTSNTTTSGKFSSGDIDAFEQIDGIVDKYDITFVGITEWDKGADTTDFDIVDTLTGDVFQLRRYKTSLGVQTEDVDKKKSEALIKDYLEWKKTQPKGSASANATTSATQQSNTQTQNNSISKDIAENIANDNRVTACFFTDSNANEDVRHYLKKIWEYFVNMLEQDINAQSFFHFENKDNKSISVKARVRYGTNSFEGDDLFIKKGITKDEFYLLIFDRYPELDFSYVLYDFEIDFYNEYKSTQKILSKSTPSQTSTQNAPNEDEDWVKKFTADLDKLTTYLPNDQDFAPELSKERKDLNALIKLLPSFQQSKYAVERAKILNEIKKLHYKLTYEGFIKPNEASSSDSDLFTPQGLLDYYFTQATQNPTAELEPACELPTPNGEKSKLPMSAYLNVRTPQFKNWFGDWEKAYETGNYVNCSKMIDPDTKEPKIYFHGVRKFVPNFGQFSNMGQGVVRPYGAFEPPSFPASYFAGEKDYAKFYGGVAENMPTPSTDYKPFIYKVFLSVKNPISLLPLDFMLSYKDFMDYIYVGYGVKVEPNQDLLNQLNNDITTKNPMWIYVRRDIGFIEMLKDYGYDAIFQIGDIPVFLPDGSVEPDRTKHLQEVEYLTFYPSQVKSATVKKSFYFDFFNDIRFKNGGYVCI